MMYIYISHGSIVGKFIRYEHSKTVIFDVYSDTMNIFDIKRDYYENTDSFSKKQHSI